MAVKAHTRSDAGGVSDNYAYYSLLWLIDCSHKVAVRTRNLEHIQNNLLQHLGESYPGELVLVRANELCAADRAHCIRWFEAHGVITAEEAELLILDVTIAMTEGQQ